MATFSENVSLVKRAFKLGGLFGALQNNWDDEEGNVTIRRGKRSSQYTKYLCYAHTIFYSEIVYQSWNIFFPDKESKEEFTLVQKFQGIVACAVLTTSVIYMHACRLKAPQIKLYLNGIIQFDRIHSTGIEPGQRVKATTIVKMNILFAHLALWSFAALPFVFVYGLHFWRPCAPSLLGYRPILECKGESKWTFGNIAVKLMVLIFNNVAWLYGISVGTFGLAIVQVLGTISLTSCLETFRRKSTNRRTTTFRSSVIYRHIQLLATINNEIQQKAVMTMSVSLGVICQGICTTAVIRIPWISENIFGILICAVLALNTTSFIMIFLTGVASIHRAPGTQGPCLNGK